MEAILITVPAGQIGSVMMAKLLPSWVSLR